MFLWPVRGSQTDLPVNRTGFQITPFSFSSSIFNGTICKPELHWYEAHGIGKKEIKIKHLIK